MATETAATTPTPTPAAAPAPTTPAAPVAAAAANVPSKKLFVGNLSFRARDDDLRNAFAPCGKIVEASIVYRGPRSLGFGFVEFETPEVAAAAVQTMNHKDLFGMAMNVELAKPKPQRSQQPRSAPVQGQQPAAFAGGQRRRGPRYGNPAPPPRGFYPMMMMPGYGMPPAMPYMAGPAAGQPPMMGAPQQRPRPQRRMQPQQPRAPTQTSSLFVSNLPFVVNDANLKDIFADLSIKDAHVVMGRDGRSRGYGFVEFETQELRDKALATLDKIEVEGRVLVIKAAMSAPTPKRTAAPAGTTAPTAPATATPAAPQKN